MELAQKDQPHANPESVSPGLHRDSYQRRHDRQRRPRENALVDRPGTRRLPRRTLVVLNAATAGTGPSSQKTKSWMWIACVTKTPPSSVANFPRQATE